MFISCSWTTYISGEEIKTPNLSNRHCYVGYKSCVGTTLVEMMKWNFDIKIFKIR